MIDHHALVRAFRQYARALLSPYEIGHVLYQLVDQAVDVLGVDGAGVSLAREGGTLSFVAATDAVVTAIEEAQIAEQDGPCHRAFRDGEPYVVTDLQDDDRWPGYRRAALDRQIRSAAGIPMPVGDARIGALNLYRARPHAWGGEELEVAQVLADMASGYILNASQLEASRTLAGQLQHALESRVVVEQAKGVLAERHGIDPHDAFQMMRARARSTNRRLHDLAAEVVAGSMDVAAEA